LVYRQPVVAVEWGCNITAAHKGNVMDQLALAYLAGVIDSDGSIGIRRSTYAMRVRGDASVPMYSERVMVRQVEPQAIALLHELFGGYRGITRPGAVRGKPLHSWQATDRKAVAVLEALRPFLLIKAAHADNALALRVVKDASRAARTPFGRKHVGGIRRPEAFGTEMHRLYLVAHELNRVGTDT
jgi:hypothetical protein